MVDRKGSGAEKPNKQLESMIDCSHQHVLHRRGAKVTTRGNCSQLTLRRVLSDIRSFPLTTTSSKGMRPFQETGSTKILRHRFLALWNMKGVMRGLWWSGTPIVPANSPFVGR